MQRCIVFTLIVLAGVLVNASDATGQPQQKGSKSSGTIARVETSMGTFEIELYPSDAPKTVENFVKLSEKKFFDGQRFHRVSKNFVIQAGDDKSKDVRKKNEWGTGGNSIWGRAFEDELNPNAPSYQTGYQRGVVAMANRGPNTNTSQFFIMLRDIPNMPKNYTIFGKVIKGMEVVDKIGQVEIEPIMGPMDGRPKVDVLIKKIRIIHSASPK